MFAAGPRCSKLVVPFEWEKQKELDLNTYTVCVPSWYVVGAAAAGTLADGPNHRERRSDHYVLATLLSDYPQNFCTRNAGRCISVLRRRTGSRLLSSVRSTVDDNLNHDSVLFIVELHPGCLAHTRRTNRVYPLHHKPKKRPAACRT